MSSSTTTASEEMRLEELQRFARERLGEDGNTTSNGRREWAVVNANTGVVVRRWNGLPAAMRMSRVPILVGLKSSPERYEEYVMKRGVTENCLYQKKIGKHVFLTVSDLHAPGSNRRNAFSFRCQDAASTSYDVTNGATSPRNSAYKWSSEAINFFRRTSSTQISFHMDVEVHHRGIGAFWTGTKVVLGDGDDSLFYPMTGPDIVVHEIAHAFTERNSGLEYFRQSGAIGESYSDMASAAFLNYFYNDDTDSVYQIGKKVSKVDLAMRDMCNPRNRRLLTYNPRRPIILSVNDWSRHTTIHNASSIYSKAFCELSKMPGWNLFHAFKVFTTANVIYWSPYETFHSGACGVKKAAYDLKGTQQALTDVDRAFAFVDVACPEVIEY